MTIPPMEFPPSNETNDALPVVPGSDVDVSVEPDDGETQEETTPTAGDGDAPADDRSTAER